MNEVEKGRNLKNLESLGRKEERKDVRNERKKIETKKGKWSGNKERKQHK